MRGSPAYCVRDVRGIPTPAIPHAHEVKPEQSNALPGDFAPHRYVTPSCESAALITTPVFDDGAATFVYFDLAKIAACDFAAPRAAASRR